MRKLLFLIAGIVLISACTNDPNKHGTSTAIDSTNVSGTAPAVYGGHNPQDDTLPKTNVDDTATKADNVHNTGYKK
jgi:hypothetical protein